MTHPLRRIAESSILRWFVRVTSRPVRGLARAYGIRLNSPWTGTGQCELIFEDPPERVKHLVPESVTFNTRSGTIRVGRDCVFGEDVHVLTGKHANIAESEQLGVELHTVPAGGRDIIFGSGCYIGSGAIIVGPCQIGDFAVIGAGAVVTKDVPSRAFVAGVPARMVRNI